MKYRILPLLAALAAILWSCSGSKEPSKLIAQAERINGELSVLAEESPMFLDSICVDYADAVLSVKVAFADQLYKAEDFSDALVQYTLAEYLKSHTGANLDEVLNTLGEEEGKMTVTILDCQGGAKEFDIPSARLKQLVKLKPMELNYTAARDNMLELMAKRAPFYAEQAKAKSAEFDLSAGFAQYTITFEKASAFRGLTQPVLTGRYVNILRPIYDEFGACRTMVEDLIKSFSIDGYRFVYTDEKESQMVKASIPWRTMN